MTSFSQHSRRTTPLEADILVDLLQESVIVIGADGRIAGWNTASERLYGWSRDEAIGRPIGDMIGGRAPPPPIELARTLGPRTRWSGEVGRSDSKGAELVVKVNWSVARDRLGEPTQVIETGIDLTQYKGASHTLELTETGAREMLQTMEACVWEIDISRAGRLLKRAAVTPAPELASMLAANPARVREMLRATDVSDVNDSAVDLFGHGKREELLRGADLFWPDESLGVLARGIAAGLSGAPAFTSKVKLAAKDGHRFDSFLTVFFPPAMLRRGRILAGIIDLSPDERWQAALRASEAFYHDMFNTATVAAWHLDAREARNLYAQIRSSGVTDIKAYAQANPEFIHAAMAGLKVVDVNETTLKLFGAADRSDVIGKSVAPFWIPGEYETLLGSIAASYNNDPNFRGETRMRTLDGRDIEVLFTVAASPELRASGQALVGIFDITDRVRAENALIEMQANFVHAARVSQLGELTASIAHEVNQPLAAITTYGEASLRWLDRPEPNITEVRRLTTRMIADARRASDIIARIRSMATPAVLTHRPLRADTLIKEAVLFLRPEFRKYGVSEITRFSPEIPDVFGDPVQLQQVLVNLMLNGMQAMAGTSRPRLLIRTVAEGEAAVRIEIEDTGPGIAEEAAERLFDSFFSTKELGMGIGLPICRSIVESHGGTITLANAPGGGARATIILLTGPPDG